MSLAVLEESLDGEKMNFRAVWRCRYSVMCGRGGRAVALTSDALGNNSQPAPNPKPAKLPQHPGEVPQSVEPHPNCAIGKSTSTTELTTAAMAVQKSGTITLPKRTAAAERSERRRRPRFPNFYKERNG